VLYPGGPRGQPQSLAQIAPASWYVTRKCKSKGRSGKERERCKIALTYTNTWSTKSPPTLHRISSASQRAILEHSKTFEAHALRAYALVSIVQSGHFLNPFPLLNLFQQPLRLAFSTQRPPSKDSLHPDIQHALAEAARVMLDHGAKLCDSCISSSTVGRSPTTSLFYNYILRVFTKRRIILLSENVI
jgi:hypothetical protein